MSKPRPYPPPLSRLNIGHVALGLALSGLVAIVAVVTGNTLAYRSARDRYEQTEIQRAGQRARRELGNELSADRGRVKEYAFWEDVYSLLGAPSRADSLHVWEVEVAGWLPPHYGDTFVALYDRGHRLRYGWRDSTRSPDFGSVAGSGLLDRLEEQSIVTGILRLEGGLYRVGAGIVRPDDPAHATLAPRGYFVLAQPLGDSLVIHLRENLQMSAAILPLPVGAPPGSTVTRIVAGGDSLETELLLHDVLGQPAGRLRIGTSRAFVVGLERRLVSLTLLSGAVALLFLAAVYAAGTLAMVRPVGAIRARLEEMRRASKLRPIDLPAPTRDWSLLIEAFNEAIATRLESQRRLLSLLSSMTDVVWSATPDGERLLYLNDAIRALTGYPPEYFYEEPYRWFELLHPDDREVARASLAELGRGTMYDLQFRLRHADGSLRWVHSRGWPFRDGTGQVIRIDGLTRDITETREMEAERSRLEEHARQAQRLEALGTMAGGIAHDFNNILSAIMGNVELATRPLPPGHPARPHLAETLRASQRAAELVRQILTFSRQGAPDRVPLRLKPVVEEAARLVRVGLPAGVEFVSRLDSATPVVRADPGQVHQVVINLCRNAWQALEDGGGRLELAVGPLPADAPDRDLVPGLAGDWAHLRVTDNGPGMDEATRQKLFEPFFTTKPAGQGTGLGLAVVHGIVRSHGALIRVESAPGAGATFHVYFPVCAEAPAELPPVERPAPPRTGARLLFVDDEAPLRQLAATVLSAQGLEVIPCADGEMALHRLGAMPPVDLVVTDLSMPGLEGVALLERLGAHRPAVPIIISTGFRGALDEGTLRRCGVVAVLEKPYALAELTAAVARVLAPASEPPAASSIG